MYSDPLIKEMLRPVSLGELHTYSDLSCVRIICMCQIKRDILVHKLKDISTLSGLPGVRNILFFLTVEVITVRELGVDWLYFLELLLTDFTYKIIGGFPPPMLHASLACVVSSTYAPCQASGARRRSLDQGQGPSRPASCWRGLRFPWGVPSVGLQPVH
jgi:hypothetical protein